MRARGVPLLIAAALLTGCAGLIEEPPGEPPQRLAPPVTPDAPAARGIAAVRLPSLSRDAYARRAETLTVRVRNLSCDGVGTGSGFAIGPNALITNRHVVAGAERLEVNTWDGRTLEVSAAEVGVLGDIAFVTVQGELPFVADLGGVAPPGDEIAAVGYPLGGPFAIRPGVVIDMVPGETLGVPGTVMRISAEVEPGNSGGPLLDRRGRVAGVVYAIEIATGFGLAIPMDTVEQLLDRAGTTGIPPCGLG